jgi:hypothetical protein
MLQDTFSRRVSLLPFQAVPANQKTLLGKLVVAPDGLDRTGWI